MSLQTLKNSRLKLILSISWVVFTFTLVLWWWIYALLQTREATEKVYRMFFWEGVILVPVLFLGGIALVWLTYKDYQRHQQLRLFFSNFSHDIKTSITRLRLQMDLLEGEAKGRPSPAMIRLMNDLATLDLQLENSLLLAKSEEQKIWIQRTNLSELISSVRPEFPELEIKVDRDAIMEVDRQAFKSVLRNLLQNASQHGQATQVQFKADLKDTKNIVLRISDNGSGLKKNIPRLSHEMILSTHEGGHGVGLYLCRRLLERMKGEMALETEPSNGFTARIQIPGNLI